MEQVLCALLITYILVLFARMLFSWLPPASGGMASLNRVLGDLTEPVLAPIRRVIPSAGGIDLSFTVLTFGLLLVWRSAC